jgi:hypothetical protein
MIRQKKGDMFAIGIVVATIVICGFLLYSFTFSSKSIKTSMLSSAMIQELNDKETKFGFYVKDSAHLAEGQAIFEIARKGAVSDSSCKPYESEPQYVIWSSTCSPASDAELFKKYFNSSFEKFVGNYHDANFTNSKFFMDVANAKAEIKFDPITLVNADEKGILKYSVEYRFNLSFAHNFEISPAEFNNIYDLSSAKLKKCKERSNDMSVITSCMSELNPEKWEMRIHSSSSAGRDYLLFDLTSKKKFFFEDDRFKWERVILRFGIAVQ